MIGRLVTRKDNLLGILYGIIRVKFVTTHVTRTQNPTTHPKTHPTHPPSNPPYPRDELKPTHYPCETHNPGYP